MKKVFLLLVLILVTLTINAQRPRGKATQRSKPRTTQRSTQRRSSNTRQNTGTKASSCPDNKHPHMIDLGLPSGTKWACCNVGASKPEAYGSYYAWGETEEKNEYREDNYHGGSFVDVAIFNSLQRREAKERAENERALKEAEAKKQGKPTPSRKAGNEIVQIDWEMPTRDQIKELLDKCKYEWTTVNGVNGGRFTGPNGRSIFLPAAGFRDDEDLYSAGSYGGYWSSTQDSSDSYSAYVLDFNSGKAGWDSDGRYNGFTVRPVSR